MRSMTKFGLAALMLGGTALMAPAASAQVSVGVGIGIPGIHIWTGGYDYNRPCSWYRYYDVPAPHRCYRYLETYWGPDIYVDGDFMFRSQADYSTWRDRPAYQHWRNHDYSYRADKDQGQNARYGENRTYDHAGNGNNGDTMKGDNMRGGDMQGGNNNADRDNSHGDNHDHDHDNNGGG